jgi:hypothetical protein
MSETEVSAIPQSVEACYTALDRAIKTLNLYMGKGELSVSSVDGLHQTIARHLETADDLILGVRSEGLTFQDKPFDTGGRTVHVYFHLFKDGLRELSFLPGLTLAEIQDFMHILVPQLDEMAGPAPGDDEEDWEGDQRDEDTVTRLWEADFTHVRYHAIDAYAEGEIFDPERGFTRSLAEQIQERMMRFRPPTGSGLQGGGGLASARQPKEFEGRGTMEIIGSTLPPEEHMQAWRSQVSIDEKLGMDRFAVIWGRLVQGAKPEETESLAELMVQMFRDWMDEGNWDALIRALKVLLSLRQRDEASQPIVSYVLNEIIAPTEVLRLLPSVEAILPEDAVKAVLFHKALGDRAVSLLCQMLQDVNIGRTISAFEMAFRKADLGIERIHLARLKSREEKILVVAVETLGNHRENAQVSEALRPLLGRNEARVRHAALRSLHGDSDPVVLKALARALTAFDQGMRHYAITELESGESGESDFSRNALLDRVETKEFAGLELVERRALIMAMARLGGEDIEDWFYDQLERKTWFKKQELEAHKQVLFECLEEAASPMALAILEDME